MSTKAKVVDHDFATSAVPAANRRSLLTMFMIIMYP